VIREKPWHWVRESPTRKSARVTSTGWRSHPSCQPPWVLPARRAVWPVH